MKTKAFLILVSIIPLGLTETKPIKRELAPKTATPRDLKIIDNEVHIAFADCDRKIPDETGYNMRKLNFRASKDVSRDEAIEILSRRVPSYNDFEPKLLTKLPKDCRVTIAREGSPCLYVKGEIRRNHALKNDEHDYNMATKETRLWWD